ncbi:MAG: ferrous iron transport protein B [Saccharofermentans sp.]|nr:ferrous iron transport protein B [Saccharofermentans sp.]
MTDGKKTIALLGQPNSGKSTLFNALTGLKQHVGNWPGKTVEKKQGSFMRNGEEFIVTDLPGTYSLSANSDEEIVTRDYISSGAADVVCIMADSSQLERSLFMLSDYAGINVPCFLVLNLADVAKDQGKTIDVSGIRNKLKIPVVLMDATATKKYDDFFVCLEEAFNSKAKLDTSLLENRLESIDGYKELKAVIPDNLIPGCSPVWMAVKSIEGDKVVRAKIENSLKGESKTAYVDIISKFDRGALLTGECKFSFIDDLLKDSVTKTETNIKQTKLDRAITHKFWGKTVVVLLVIGGLLLSFIPAVPLMMLGSVFTAIAVPVRSALESANASPIITGIICDVIFQSLANTVKMLGFAFGITLVFGMFEESGIMARISYVFDNTMSKMGLQGKSVMPFLVSFGCTIGGATSSRVIDNWGQKVLTIALAWAVPCGAAWAIIPMLATNFFGWRAVLVIVAILLVMLVHIWITAKVFGGRLVKKEDRYGIIMELPPYHKPKWGALFRYVLGRTKDMFFRVIKVIIPVCLVFWILSYSAGSIEDSILYKVGTAIEPVTKLFGLNWQLFMAFVASSIGKEGAVGVLTALYSQSGTIYGAVNGTNAAVANSTQLLLSNISGPEALAFMFAITFNVPCVVALAATYQETHSAKWTGIITAYYTVGALIISCIVYHIGLLIM